MLKQYYPNLGQYPGFKYAQVNALPWGGTEDSEFAGAIPAVANGDIVATPPTTSPDNFALTISNTGVPVVNAAGSRARQNFALDVYDISMRQWYGLVTDYLNDAAPVILDPTAHQFFYVRGVPITQLNLGPPIAVDPEGDQVLVGTTSALPPGLSFANNVLSGTPSVNGLYVVNFIARDTFNQAAAFPPYTFTVQDLHPTPPPPVGVFVAGGGRLEVYPGYSSLELVGSWTGDSTHWTGDGAVSGYPQGAVYTWTGDGGIYRISADPTSCLLAWSAIAGATSYNVYVNGSLDQVAYGLLATVSGLHGASYDASTGVVTPAGVYTFEVVGVANGLELSATRAVTITMPPASVALITPMKRLWPFPNTGLD